MNKFLNYSKHVWACKPNINEPTHRNTDEFR